MENRVQRWGSAAPFAIGLSGLAVAACLLIVPAAQAVTRGKDISIDVACDANTFVFQGPTSPAGPDYGASFVVQGVIYREGTFAARGFNSGLLANGDPEFSELVIGEWTCKGWFIGDGLATVSGPFVVTTQIYDLELDLPGLTTLVSEGFELIDLNVPLSRAVTGGTGDFRQAKGEVAQLSVGINATGLFNLTFEFDV